MSPTLNYISSTLSMVAMVFYIVGAIGYSSDGDVIKSVAWIIVKNNGVSNYFGLRDAYTTAGGQDGTSRYSDCKDQTDLCDKCNDDGKGAFALCIIGAVVALLTMSACGTLSRQVSFPLQLTSILLAAGACIAGVISLSLFMGDCYDEVDDNTSSDLEWGAGSSLVIIAMFLMAGAAVIQIASTFICTSSA